MQRLAATVVVGLLTAFLSPSSSAQSATWPATQKGFSFCTVHDTAGRTVWASPVFEYEYSPGEPGYRTPEMATEFHALIGSMGGAGDKTCSVANADRATVEGWRDEQRDILTARFMGVLRTHKWLDVAWTPKPWTPALMAKPAVVSKHFYCYGTDTDQGNLRASSVASPVFEGSMDGTDPMAPYTLAEEYGKQFTRYVIDVHGLTQANPSCDFKDTQAEADKALHDYRRMFSGYNLKFVDVVWRPAGEAIATPAAPASRDPASAPSAAAPSTEANAPVRIGVSVAEVTPALALGLGLAQARGALVVEVLPGSPALAAGLKPMDVVLAINDQAVGQSTDLPVISSGLPAGRPASLRVWRERAEIDLQVHIDGSPVDASTQVGADIADAASVPVGPPGVVAGSRKYCYAFINQVNKRGGVQSNIWESSSSDGSEADMTATLAAFVEHMRRQQPDRWEDLTVSPMACNMATGFCYASALRHSGRSQIAGQFCKATRQEADADWGRLSGTVDEMESIAWPAAR